jgi:hypothetical protein
MLCWPSVDTLLTLCWHSVDAVFILCWRSLAGVGTSSLTILPPKVVDTSIMAKSHITALGLFKMQHPRLFMLCSHPVDAHLMLCWCSVDAQLMFCWCSVDTHCQVKRRWHYPYCQCRRPILLLWIKAVAQPLDDTRHNTQNRWCSVEAHFQTKAMTMLPSLLPILAANTLIMSKCGSTTLGL